MGLTMCPRRDFEVMLEAVECTSVSDIERREFFQRDTEGFVEWINQNIVNCDDRKMRRKEIRELHGEEQSYPWQKVDMLFKYRAQDPEEFSQELRECLRLSKETDGLLAEKSFRKARAMKSSLRAAFEKHRIAWIVVGEWPGMQTARSIIERSVVRLSVLRTALRIALHGESEIKKVNEAVEGVSLQFERTDVGFVIKSEPVLGYAATSWEWHMKLHAGVGLKLLRERQK
jgi:hypothetical protein